MIISFTLLLFINACTVENCFLVLDMTTVFILFGIIAIIPNKMKTVVISKTRKQFSTVQALINNNKVNEIIIATDAGREGELVARLILDKAHNQRPSQ